MTVQSMARIIVALIGLLMVPGSVLAQAEESGFRLQRVSGDPPEYPRKAFQDGVEGWVDLEITVNPEGRVENVVVVDAEPKRVFERAAIRAAMRWRFSPPKDAGLDDNQSGVIRIHFRLNG